MAINVVVADNIFREVLTSSFHTLIIEESTNIAEQKMVVWYFKYRFPNLLLYKTVFGGIIQLTACNALALEKAIQGYNSNHQIDINCLVMLTSDGTSVKLGRWNGLAALLKRTVTYLSEQHTGKT